MAPEDRRSKASMPPLPKKDCFTMKACFWFSVLTCASMLLCVTQGGVGPRWEQHVESDSWHAGAAVLLVFSLAITELCILVGGSSNAYISESIQGDDARKVNLPGADHSWLTLLEYLAKIAVGVYTYTGSGGITHTDSLALNGARPVYMARFAQWSFAVPVIVLITNSSFIDSRALLFRRSAPSCWAAFSYVWASWLAVVTPHHSVRWLMMALALAGCILVLLDQLKIAGESRATRCYNLKVGLLWYSKFIDLFYTAVFLMGRFGMISSSTEHMIYPYSDATAKVFHGALLAMIRNREGAYEISRWCNAAIAAGNDLKNMLRLAKIPTLTIDLSGNIVQWNESIAHLTGLQEANVHGKSLLSLSDDSSMDELSKVLTHKMKAFETGTSSTDLESGLLELSIVTHTSQHTQMPPVRRLAMTLVPKRNAAGELEGITAIGQDLSEIADLRMVQERKNAFLAMLGHEIRTPLHGMMGLTCALLENPESKPLHRQLGMVKGCTACLLDLVNNIMDLAQSEKKRISGIKEAKPTALVDLPGIVEEALVMIGNAIDKSNTPLLKPGVRLMNESVGAKVPLVRGDAYKCTQLLYNLLTNAAKFTDRGSVSVTFRHLPAARRLEIDVTDTGKGISEEGVKRIFSPFEQENSGDCQSYQGVGLGLAVCKEIAELHEGSLRVQSVVGQGSTFTFSLPCDGDLGTVEVKGESVVASRVAETKVPARRASNPSIESCRPSLSESVPVRGSASNSGSATKPLILSVDDDDVNQEVVKNALSEVFDVVCKMSGPETLVYLDDLVQNEQPFPELILLDIQMPGMTGFEVCERVRKHYGSKGASLPVMMLSAKAPADKTAIQSFECGATDFIAKPFHTEILRKKVVAFFNFKANGVQFAGVEAAASEACQRLRQYEMEATKAKEQAADLEAKMSETEARAVHAIEKAKHFEHELASLRNASEHAADLEAKLHETEARAVHAADKAKRFEYELTSLRNASEAQNIEMLKLSKKCEEMTVKMQRKELRASPPSTKMKSNARSTLNSSARVEIVELNGGTSTQRKVDPVLDASVAVKLLASRLKVCSTSAKHCKKLLLCPAAPGARHVDTTALEPSDYESSYYQLKELRRHTHVAASELDMLEKVASSVNVIIKMMDDGELSTDSELLERQSTTTSESSKYGWCNS